MSIYSGVVGHKGSYGSDHLTGEVRIIEGATDNSDLAMAFGVTPIGTGKKSFNGKLQLTELTNPNRTKAIYVDYKELNIIDDLTFIRKHINAVSDWQALAQFMENEHNVDIRSALIDMGLNINYATLSNSQRAVIIRYIFGRATVEEVRKIISQDDPNQLTDVIVRSVLGKSRSRTFEAHGLTGTVTVTTTDAYTKTEDTRLKITANTVRIPINTKVVIEGSKAGFPKKYANQFGALKRFLTDTIISEHEKFDVPTSYTHRFRRTSNLEELVQELADKVSDDLKNSISKYLKAVDSLTPTIVGIESLDNFNPISAWKKFLTEVGIKSTLFAKIDKEEAIKDLRAYIDNEMSAQEFLNKYSERFTDILKSDLVTRFTEGNYSAEAYLERTRDTLQGIIISSDEESTALNIINDTVSDYREIIESIDDVNELLELYHQTNITHDSAIITEAGKRLMEFISNKRQDDNAETYGLFKDYFDIKLASLVDDKVESFVSKNNFSSSINLPVFSKLILEKESDRAFIDFMAQAPLKLSEKNYRDIIDNYVGGIGHIVDSWLSAIIEQIGSENTTANQNKERLIELFEIEIDRNTGKNVPFDIYELAEKYDINIDRTSETFKKQFQKILTEMNDIALYDQIENYFNSLSSSTLQMLSNYDEQLSFVRDVYNVKINSFIDNVLKKYDNQLRVLADKELSSTSGSKLLLSESAKLRDSSYYMEDAKEFIQEYLDTVTNGYLTFDVKYPKIASELKLYQLVLANWIDGIIKQKIASTNSKFIKHINEIGVHETNFLSWQLIQDKIYTDIGYKLDIWRDDVAHDFISSIYKENDSLTSISFDRIFNFIDQSLKNEYQFFVLDPKTYAGKIADYFKDKKYDRNMLLSSLKSQIKYAANFDGKVFENNGLTVDAILEKLEIAPEKVDEDHKNDISNLLELIKQKYYEECLSYISEMPEGRIEELFADVDILEVDPEKVYFLLEDNISRFIRKAYYEFEIKLERLEEELMDMYHNNYTNWTKDQWQNALKEYSSSELANRIGWEINGESLKILEELHRSNILRVKIEDLLEECNFHTERDLWIKGQYEFSEAQNIFNSSSWHYILDEYLNNKDLFTEETVQDYFNSNARFDNELLDTLRYEWNRAFISAVYTELHENQNSLMDLIDFKNKSINADKFIDYINSHQEEFKQSGFNRIRATLARNVLGGKVLTNDFVDVLQAYLVESLENYLRSQYIPEKLIHNNYIKNDFIALFMQNDEIIKYYEFEIEKNNVDAIKWLKVNLPFENLNTKCWSKHIDSVKESYINELIDKIRDNTRIDYTKNPYTAIVEHPSEAANVYDDKISVDDFVESYMVFED